MTTIHLDITRLLTRLRRGQLSTGIDRVAIAYVRQYRTHARAVLSFRGHTTVLSEALSQRAFDIILASARESGAINGLLARAWAMSFAPRRQTQTRGVVLHTSHNGMEHERYYNTMTGRNVRSVFMIHDLIPLSHAEYCRPGVDVAHRNRIHTALRLADGLIANSQDTLNALVREADSISVTMPPAVVARLAPGIEAGAQMPSPLDSPYFVMLGTIEPRKNHWFILHVWRQIIEQMGEFSPKLVIIGRRGWECENVIDMLDRCVSLRGFVIEQPDCSDEQLRAWLQHARALLFPSFVEGYGMPLVEALLLRAPVIASDLPVFHEIAGDIPDYLDPLDGKGWLTHIQAYATPASPERDAQIGRITGFRAPTWSEHFACVDDFLDAFQ